MVQSPQSNSIKISSSLPLHLQDYHTKPLYLDRTQGTTHTLPNSTFHLSPKDTDSMRVRSTCACVTCRVWRAIKSCFGVSTTKRAARAHTPTIFESHKQKPQIYVLPYSVPSRPDEVGTVHFPNNTTFESDYRCPTPRPVTPQQRSSHPTMQERRTRGQQGQQRWSLLSEPPTAASTPRRK